MNEVRTVASAMGRVVLLTSLLCLVLVLAVVTAGPALAFAIFSAVLVLSPLPIPRATVAAPVAARRRRFSPRAPPVF